MDFSLTVASGGYSLAVVHGLHIAVASPAVEPRFWGMRASVVVAHGLDSCGIPGLVAPWHVGSSQTRDHTLSPALAGGFFTTQPPENPSSLTKHSTGSPRQSNYQEK